ncbi:hypothetical protein ACIO3O_39110 [Streptomyces sp. NPDC087440]|uniref:hypothetical protein n=1 Tax=Streptomyces sp. NPDC087440 TaxID=3365790 RepID=UPI0037F61C32
MSAHEEALRQATSRCQEVEHALDDARSRYHTAQAAAARADSERHRAQREAVRSEVVLLATLAQQDAAVAALTAVLETRLPHVADSA